MWLCCISAILNVELDNDLLAKILAPLPVNPATSRNELVREVIPHPTKLIILAERRLLLNTKWALHLLAMLLKFCNSSVTIIINSRQIDLVVETLLSSSLRYTLVCVCVCVFSIFTPHTIVIISNTKCILSLNYTIGQYF